MVLLKNDCEKGDGVALAKKYGVAMYPTYAMVDAAGEVTDRWAGYEGVAPFAATLDAALADPRPIARKKEAFAQAPTLALALALANHSEATSASADAVGYYDAATKLDPSLRAELRLKAFLARFGGLRSGQFQPQDVVVAGEEIVADPATTPEEHVLVAQVLGEVAPPERYVPVLKGALAATAGSSDPELAAARRELEVDEALYVAQDPDLALRLKRATLPEGWRDQPSRLNGFAWWCFEHDVNLDEAFTLAMRGAELSPDGVAKAQILDTAAEIAFKQGDRQRAIELQEEAVRLAPHRKGLQETLARFRAGS